MLNRLIAAALALFSAAVFAAVDVNKANQADLESIKGIGPMIATKILDERKKGSFKDWNDMIERVKGVGEHNAARFSTDGLTVNGAAFTGAPAATTKAANPATTARTSTKAPDAGAMTKGSATAPAASSATMAKTKAEERAEKKAARDEAKAAKAEAKTDAKTAKSTAASAPAATKTAASAPAAKK